MSRPRYDTPANPRKNLPLTLVAGVVLVYSLVPFAWLIFNSTKSESGLASSFGLWFADRFSLWENIVETLTYQDGVFVRWLGNTLLYVVVGAGGATLFAALGGYALALYDFRGKKVVLGVVLSAIAIPGTALAVPTFLLFSSLGLTNTMISVIIPLLASPFGLYLMWTFASDAIPVELIEAARIDGAGEWRIFWRIAAPLLAPGTVTVLLFSIVAAWNNYFLPLIMLRNPALYPLTVGLTAWNNQASTAGGDAVYNLVITGSLLTIIPLVAAFLVLQRYWQAGLAAGSIKG